MKAIYILLLLLALTLAVSSRQFFADVGNHCGHDISGLAAAAAYPLSVALRWSGSAPKYVWSLFQQPQRRSGISSF